MTDSITAKILCTGISFNDIINFEIVKGNTIWRFAAVLIVIIVAMAAGKIVQFFIDGFANKKEEAAGANAFTIFLKCLTKPISVAIFGMGLMMCKTFLVFEKEGVEGISPAVEGISLTIKNGWTQIASAVIAISVAYAIYRLVDVVEHYLILLTSKTETKLDDMLVPVVRKSLRVTIFIFSVIYIIDNILNQDVKSILLGAGVGGIAIALAAKDTIANFFGSVTIFTDRPFQIDELVRIEGHYGPVEEVGFRSTKVRTTNGHLVTIPNNTIANTVIENVSRRPFIRRTANLTITYDAGHEKAKKAVEIIKEILEDIEELNALPNKPPRVFFSDFNDWSLNIYMSYWMTPPDYWLSHKINERVNLEMMKRFEKAGIEFAFPTQTLYLKKDSEQNLT
ncbi:MAG: mechanosensitive ion channel family protein [Planctomycetes bacterium]|nr:mechanosensitive ion channel family protein [Planctomycetota bacterium]